jgi:hypothetical protein
MVGRVAPAEHNLAGVDVPAGADLGMVDTPSIVVDTEAADMACMVAHIVAEESVVVEGFGFGPVCFVPGYPELGYPEVVARSVPAGFDVDCYAPAVHSVEAVHSGFVEDRGVVPYLV